MIKKFSELSIGSRFVMNSVEYTKTQPIKISCCQSVNACVAGRPNEKIFVQPNQEVQVNG